MIWTASTEEGLPGHGDPPVYLHVGSPTPWSEGLVVRFASDEGSSWIANVRRGHGYQTALWRWEAANRFVVVAGGDAFLVNPQAPSEWTFLTHLATSCLFAEDGANAFIATYTDVVAIDSNGVKRWVRQLAIDGVEFAGLTRGVLEGKACMDPPEDWSSFRLSAEDGSDA